MGRRADLARYEDCIGAWWRADDPKTRLEGTLARKRRRGWWELRLHATDRDPERPTPGAIAEGTTWFGETSAGLVTLRQATLGAWESAAGASSANATRHRSERWRAPSATLGVHADTTSPWTAISVAMPHAWSWFSPTQIEPRSRDVLTEELNESLACTYGELSLTLWRHASVQRGTSGRGITGLAEYVFEGNGGVSVDQIEQPLLALANLHHVLFGESMTADVLRLRRDASLGGSANALHVTARKALTQKLDLAEPYLGTGDVDFETFLPNWIALHCDAAVWPVLEPAGKGAWLHSQVVEAVSALEAFARQVGRAEHTTTERETRIAAVAANLRSDDRRYLRKLLERDRVSLTQRLTRLANSLGPRSAQWLLGESVESWATVVARARNDIAHGLERPGSLVDNIEALFAILDSARAILQLAMLRAAGFTNASTSTPGELLVDERGRCAIRRRNALLAHRLEMIRSRREIWQGLARETASST